MLICTFESKFRVVNVGVDEVTYQKKKEIKFVKPKK